MTLLIGADSAVPQPDLYRGHTIWGVYVAGDTPHVWTQAEIAALGLGGVRGVLPIVVPPQDHAWWAENEGYGTLEALVRDAVAWGLPKGAPLALDVEEAQAVRIGPDTGRCWAIACVAHGYRPWLYGPAGFLDRDHWCHHWLAKWYGDAGEDHEAPVEIPPHHLGWQYAGDVEGGRIDRDVFAPGHTFLTPELKVEVIMNEQEAAEGTPVPGPEQQQPESVAAATEPVVAPEVPAEVEAATEPAPEAVTPSDAEVKALADAAAAKLELAEARDKLHAWVDSFFA